MRRAYFLIFLVFAVPVVTFGQATPSDSQTLQSVLTEVRELRQDLRVSLARVQRFGVRLTPSGDERGACFEAGRPGCVLIVVVGDRSQKHSCSARNFEFAIVGS
jgi:hypothetical protein